MQKSTEEQVVEQEAAALFETETGRDWKLRFYLRKVGSSTPSWPASDEEQAAYRRRASRSPQL